MVIVFQNKKWKERQFLLTFSMCHSLHYGTVHVSSQLILTPLQRHIISPILQKKGMHGQCSSWLWAHSWPHGLLLLFSCIQLFATPWTEAHQASLVQRVIRLKPNSVFPPEAKYFRCTCELEGGENVPHVSSKSLRKLS